jgi:ATP-dependent DNA helicase RecQ
VVDKVHVAFNELKKEIAIKPIFEKLNEAVSYGEIRMSLTLTRIIHHLLGYFGVKYYF